jgi:prolyl-tRNA editing enzyme YbaK/EbsC (Cys-tRNA(Pro) deacylase)
MWPEPVERIAGLLRTTGVQGKLEELPAGVDEPPGPAFRAFGFDCDGGGLVALVPTDREVDRDKVKAAAKCTSLKPGLLPEFPFQPARVLVDRSVLSAGMVWLEAGSPRHVLGLAPSQLLRVTRSQTADLLRED